jgi:Icc-related predicted phosphoesterase
MKLLALSDTESPYLYDYFDAAKFKSIDLVLCAGDLKADYMSYIATVIDAPVLYVHGNHDGSFILRPPEGCIDIDGKFYTHKGLRIFGMGGCMEYYGGPFQFTERQMASKLLLKEWQLKKGIDLFLTHAPAYGVGDGKDVAHTGFRCFVKLLDRHKPKWMVHGHQHLNYDNQARTRTYKTTQVINAYGYTIIEV